MNSQVQAARLQGAEDARQLMSKDLGAMFGVRGCAMHIMSQGAHAQQQQQPQQQPPQQQLQLQQQPPPQVPLPLLGQPNYPEDPGRDRLDHRDASSDRREDSRGRNRHRDRRNRSDDSRDRDRRNRRDDSRDRDRRKHRDDPDLDDHDQAASVKPLEPAATTTMTTWEQQHPSAATPGVWGTSGPAWAGQGYGMGGIPLQALQGSASGSGMPGMQPGMHPGMLPQGMHPGMVPPGWQRGEAGVQRDWVGPYRELPEPRPTGPGAE